MKITNLKPEMSTLEKVDNLNYNLDYGVIKKGSDPNLKIYLEDFSDTIRVKASCGACTKINLKNNVLNINYNTNLSGRILKKVYIFEKDKTIKIHLKGKIV